MDGDADAQGRLLGSNLHGGRPKRQEHVCPELPAGSASVGAEFDLSTVRSASMKLSVEMNSGDGKMHGLNSGSCKLASASNGPSHAAWRGVPEYLLGCRYGFVRSPLPKPTGIASKGAQHGDM